MTKLVYSLFYLVSLIPLRCLYILSDFLAWIAGSVLRYRHKVIADNLRSSFPDFDEREVKRIEKEFYRFLTDYFVETIKLASISPRKMLKRLVVENPELVNDATARGQSTVIYLGHYCNWEWVSSLPLSLTPGTIAAQIYHPLENKTFDQVFYRLRTRFHAHNVPMESTLRTLLGWKREGRPSVTGFIADQAPGMNIHLFVDFLNHDTGVYTGPERIADALKANVVYAHITRPKRGRYHLRFIPIAQNAKEMPMFEITRKYFELLEANIREAPQYWLWSHRRWKRTREHFYQFHGAHADEMLTHL